MKPNAAALASKTLFILFLAVFAAVPVYAAGQKQADKTEFTESICPTCHSKENVVPIVYGYPDQTLMEEANAGKVKLGGCVIQKNNPRWFCKKCQSDW